MKKHPGIRIDKIPVKSVAGLLFAIGSMSIFLIGVPQVRGFLVVGLPGGVLVGIVLYLLRSRRNGPESPRGISLRRIAKSANE